MKIANAIAFADDTATTIQVRFPKGEGWSAPYTFRALKSFVVSIDDFVVVDTQTGLAVGKVTRIDEEADIELDSNIDYRWAFQLINTASLEELKAQDQSRIAQLKTEQRRAMQRKIRAMLESNAPLEAIEGLATEKSEEESEPVPVSSRAGEPWSSTEEHRLRREYTNSDRSDNCIKGIALKFGRSEVAIISRLEKLGYEPGRD